VLLPTPHDYGQLIDAAPEYYDAMCSMAAYLVLADVCAVLCCCVVFLQEYGQLINAALECYDTFCFMAGCKAFWLTSAVLCCFFTPQEYGQLIDAALEYYDVVGSEEAAEMVLRADDAPVNMYEDINPELIGAIDAFGDDEEGFSREGQFVERILELGRVTKVRGTR
jgi:hypothetical protein